MREAFEQCNPVPKDAAWSERKQGYYWKDHPGVSHPFDNDWMTWQDACDWQSKRGSQESLKFTAIAEVRRNEAGQVYVCKPDGAAFQLFDHVGVTLYQRVETETFCEWRREPNDFDGNDWVSSCGASFSFIDDGPIQNGFEHCPKCGQNLRDADSPQQS